MNIYLRQQCDLFDGFHGRSTHADARSAQEKEANQVEGHGKTKGNQCSGKGTLNF